MVKNGCQVTADCGKRIAAIDIGSHTARLLVSELKGSSQPLFSSILRKREYIRLADGLDSSGSKDISIEALIRTLEVIQGFIEAISNAKADIIKAVATGVVRVASNREWFLEQIFEKTGIKVSIISGEREAVLTRKGVLSSLPEESELPLTFDLGGGTAEFTFKHENSTILSSLPLGAMVLTNAYLGIEPPEDESIARLKNYIDDMLFVNLSGKGFGKHKFLMVGSGGTVTALAAILRCIDVKEIVPENINGLILTRDTIEDLFLHMKSLSVIERLEITGMDPGRSEVILAGTLAVIRILYFFKAAKMMVSFSDILEGITIAYLQGEKDE